KQHSRRVRGYGDIRPNIQTAIKRRESCHGWSSCLCQPCLQKSAQVREIPRLIPPRSTATLESVSPCVMMNRHGNSRCPKVDVERYVPPSTTSSPRIVIAAVIEHGQGFFCHLNVSGYS